MDGLTIDEKYKEGFEIGYWLTKGSHKEVLDRAIDCNSVPKNQYYQGLLAGKKEAQREILLRLRINGKRRG
jgi:hypothetical protein